MENIDYIDYSTVDTETLWEDLDLAVEQDNVDRILKLLPWLDYMWGELFDWSSEVTFLAQPYNNRCSKFIYLDHVQLHLELGCFILKLHDCSQDDLNNMVLNFTSSPDKAEFVAPLMTCPHCDNNGLQPVVLHDAEEAPLDDLHKMVNPNHQFRHKNTIIKVASFNPECPPPELERVLKAKRYKNPIRTKFCAKTPECPGFPTKMFRAARKPMSRGVRNFFQMSKTATKINEYASKETNQQ